MRFSAQVNFECRRHDDAGVFSGFLRASQSKPVVLLGCTFCRRCLELETEDLENVVAKAKALA